MTDSPLNDFDPGDFNTVPDLLEEDDGVSGEDPALREEHAGRKSYVPLAFVDVVMVLPSTHPVLILEELDEPYRQLRIPIGSTEGFAISYGSQGIVTPKPLTHALFTEALEAFDISLEVVRITAVESNSYSAEIVLSSMQGQRVIPCRPSDAIALALRQSLLVPITAAEEVLDQAGFAKSGTN